MTGEVYFTYTKVSYPQKGKKHNNPRTHWQATYASGNDGRSIAKKFESFGLIDYTQAYPGVGEELGYKGKNDFTTETQLKRLMKNSKSVGINIDEDNNGEVTDKEIKTFVDKIKSIFASNIESIEKNKYRGALYDAWFYIKEDSDAEIIVPQIAKKEDKTAETEVKTEMKVDNTTKTEEVKTDKVDNLTEVDSDNIPETIPPMDVTEFEKIVKFFKEETDGVNVTSWGDIHTSKNRIQKGKLDTETRYQYEDPDTGIFYMIGMDEDSNILNKNAISYFWKGVPLKDKDNKIIKNVYDLPNKEVYIYENLDLEQEKKEGRKPTFETLTRMRFDYYTKQTNSYYKKIIDNPDKPQEPYTRVDDIKAD